MLYIKWNCHLVFVFFQAEDGIRDLVRSRGLGDVYKRQIQAGVEPRFRDALELPEEMQFGFFAGVAPFGIEPVSYTHLTLPTSDLV